MINKHIASTCLLLLGITSLNCKDNVSPDTNGNTNNEDNGKKAPNLVFIFSDQHAYDMLGCYGNRQVKSPNIDKFSEDAVRFTHCFSNCPVSTPYRGMLLSGQHSLYNGTYANDRPLLPGHGKKLGEVLTDAGYSTAYIGKWHLLGGDRNRPIPKDMRYGFNEIFYTNNCHVDYRAGKCFYWDENDEKKFFDTWEVYGQTNQALDYLDSVKDSDKPFAMVVSWHPPHDWGKFKGEDGKQHYRYDATDELMAMYDRQSMQMRTGCEPTNDRKRMYHGYMASITGVDIAFGQIIEKLKSIGKYDNTLIVFTADHGDMLEFMDATKPKEVPYDYSCRVPLLMRMPEKLKESRASSLMISALDMMPTVLGLLGLDVPSECQGKNLAEAIISGDDMAVESIPIWLYHGEGYRGVITRDYTFAMQPDTKTPNLYNVLFDRKKDPNQLTNLFNNPDYAGKQAELKALTEKYMRQYGDEFWSLPDFLKAMTAAEWNNNRTLRPIDVMKNADLK